MGTAAPMVVARPAAATAAAAKPAMAAAVAPEAKATPTHQVANAEAATAVGLLATAAEGTEMARVAV